MKDMHILAILIIVSSIWCIVLFLLMMLKIITPSWWGFVYPIYAIFLLVIAYGFLKAKNWARIIFLLMMVIAAIISLVQNLNDPTVLIFPMISYFVIFYILTRPHVKTYFEKNKNM